MSLRVVFYQKILFKCNACFFKKESNYVCHFSVNIAIQKMNMGWHVNAHNKAPQRMRERAAKLTRYAAWRSTTE